MNHASAYHQIGVQTGVSGATPHKLVSMLYDGYMDALTEAVGAMRKRDAVGKGRAIGRAARIIEEGLKAGLDLQNGGELARSLRDLYAYVAMRLTKANLDNDEAILDECRRLIEPLRSAWHAIGNQVDSRVL